MTLFGARRGSLRHFLRVGNIFSETALVGGMAGGVALPNLFAARVGREKESLCSGCPAVALGIEPLPRQASPSDCGKAFDSACLGAMSGV